MSASDVNGLSESNPTYEIKNNSLQYKNTSSDVQKSLTAAEEVWFPRPVHDLRRSEMIYEELGAYNTPQLQSRS